MVKEFAKAVLPSGLWDRLRRLRYSPDRPALGRFVADARDLGVGPATTLLFSLLKKWSQERPARGDLESVRRICLRSYRHPFYFRDGTSDFRVIRHVFSRREYACVSDEAGVSLIIDCGANIGCTSFYFLHRYPNARVIAVEPDPGNFAMCRRNLRPFADRVLLVNAAVWPLAVPLHIERRGYRDGGEWSFQVRPCDQAESGDVAAVTIDDLLRLAGADRVDLLKIDIEAAERQLFAHAPDSWIRRTRTLIIELHDDECEQAFRRGMAPFRWLEESHGELTVCRDIRPKSAAACRA